MTTRHRRTNVALQSGFDPRSIPEVAAGYWWTASQATGLGTTGFVVPEGNGHSTFNLVQPTLVNQPTMLTENNGIQFRMVAAAGILQTAGAVQAGWTGATYMAGWFRVPDASGDITSSVALITHSAGNGSRRMDFTAVLGTPDAVGGRTSADGTASVVQRVSNAGVFAGGNWAWAERVFDPALTLGGSAAADRAKVFANFTLQTPLAAMTVLTTLFDASLAISVGSSVGLANSDTTDWAAAFYCNGIPSLANRQRLANGTRPIAALL